MNTTRTPESLTNEEIYNGLRHESLASNNFAQSLSSQLVKGRHLSDKQEFWARKLAFQALFPVLAIAANSTDLGNGFSKLVELFNTAKSNGLKRPALTYAGVCGCDKVKIYPAAGTSQNAGYLYVKADGIYYGKISSEGRLFPSRDCSEDAKTWLKELASDPIRVSAVNGRKTGNCCFCARTLTTNESVSVGYGPICAEKYGLPWGDSEGEEISDCTITHEADRTVEAVVTGLNTFKRTGKFPKVY